MAVVRRRFRPVLPSAGRRRLDPRVHVQHSHLAQEQHFVDQPLGDNDRLPVHLPELVGHVPPKPVVVVGHRRFRRVAAHAAQYLRLVQVGRRLSRPVQYPPLSLRSSVARAFADAAVHYHLQAAGRRRRAIRLGGTVRFLVLGPGPVLVNQDRRLLL